VKLLAFSDLHIHNKYTFNEIRKKIAPLLRKYNPDIVIITGDIFEAACRVNPYKKISQLIGEDTPVVCTLGNHEFYGRTIEDTHDYYGSYYNPDKYDIHYLDLNETHRIGDIHFYGNVLWYDGSMMTYPNQNMDDFAHGGWPDINIVDFNWIEACRKCKNKILTNQNFEKDVSSILLTHCAPDVKLNGHMYPALRDNGDPKPNSSFNAFSGVDGFLNCVKADWAICGHTHWKVPVTEISGTKAVNIGTSWGMQAHHFFEV
jgi:predicted MPP superfamily phosphohydrolase